MSGARPITAELLSGSALYREVVLGKLAHARESVWIATANVKDLHLERSAVYGAGGGAGSSIAGGKRDARRHGSDYVSILELFSQLWSRGVELRLLHADLPSRPFRASFDKQAGLVAGGLKLRICPRVHFKAVIVDGAWVYLGSANLTGAGLGAKGEGKRNFELGFVTEDFDVIDRSQALFESVWSGAECGTCQVYDLCPDPIGPGPKPRRGRGRARGGSASKPGLIELGKTRRFGR